MICRAPLSQCQPESGFAFMARTNRPALSAHARPSSARVLEDGRPLPGPANALHDDIRQIGRGCFSFWHDYLYFAASDNTDPRTNGRSYEIEYSIDPLTAFALSVRDSWKARRRVKRVPVVRGAYGADVLLRMWKRLGLTPSPQTTMLDFGCGAGERVDALRDKGYDAVGCDIALPDGATALLRDIATEPYRLPYDDHVFDLVYSITVFEHVMDYEAALAEIRRVLKPGGMSVHVFPSRWKPIETHAYVPFASRIQSYWWLHLWALAGIRNEFQQDLSARDTADANVRFLTRETNYLSKRQIREHVRRHFARCEFVEEAAFRPEKYDFFVREHRWLLAAYRWWSSATNVRVLVCR
jgi:SAM-dependent methyltransferase